MIPYGRQMIDEDDIAAVLTVLRSEWLTTGPQVGAFERSFAATVGSREAVAVSSGTAALHAAMHAIGLSRGDEVILPAMTFIATANAIVYKGARPVIVDVDPDTLLIDPQQVIEALTPRTKAIIAVDYAGQPCDYDRLREIARKAGIVLITDGCHALGAIYRGRPVGSIADITVFSFHPVKHITTGEGGMMVTDIEEFAESARRFRNHGIDSDHHRRSKECSWEYSMVELGYNYRLTDMQCALGLSQLSKKQRWLAHRHRIAGLYDELFASNGSISPLQNDHGRGHAYHLYVVRLRNLPPEISRRDIFAAMREQGIGVNVHYRPVHLQPYYRRQYGTEPGDCPVAESAYEEILSLPIHAAVAESEINYIAETLGSLVTA